MDGVIHTMDGVIHITAGDIIITITIVTGEVEAIIRGIHHILIMIIPTEKEDLLIQTLPAEEEAGEMQEQWLPQIQDLVAVREAQVLNKQP